MRKERKDLRTIVIEVGGLRLRRERWTERSIPGRSAMARLLVHVENESGGEREGEGRGGGGREGVGKRRREKVRVGRKKEANGGREREV